MLSQFNIFLDMIFTDLEPRYWAPACAGLLASKTFPDTEWEKAFEYIERIINVRAFRDDPNGALALELVKRRVYPGQVGGNANVTHTASVAIPLLAERNAAFAATTPEDVRRSFGFDKNDQNLSQLKRIVEEYVRHCPIVDNITLINTRIEPRKAEFICAVQPYIDTILATVAIYMVSDLLDDGVLVKFVPLDWTKVPDVGKSIAVHMSYGSENVLNNKYFEFIRTKKQPSRMPCVQSTILQQDSYCPPALNFVGYYSESASTNCDMLVKLNFGTNIKQVVATSVESIYDQEASALIALAAGSLSADYVIMTNAAFLWLADTGLLYKDFGNGFTIGSLKFGEVVNSSPEDVVGYAVKKTKNSPVAQKLMHRIESVVEDMEKFVADSTSQSKRPHELVSSLKAPMAIAYGYDSGILTRINASLALEMAFPKGKYYEREVDYRPCWWETLEKAFLKTGNSTIQSAK